MCEEPHYFGWARKASLGDDIRIKPCRTGRMGLGQESHRAEQALGKDILSETEKRKEAPAARWSMGTKARELQGSEDMQTSPPFLTEGRDFTALLGICILNPFRMFFRV